MPIKEQKAGLFCFGAFARVSKSRLLSSHGFLIYPKLDMLIEGGLSNQIRFLCVYSCGLQILVGIHLAFMLILL